MTCESSADIDMVENLWEGSREKLPRNEIYVYARKLIFDTLKKTPGQWITDFIICRLLPDKDQ
jgi:hypothetical protein